MKKVKPIDKAAQKVISTFSRRARDAQKEGLAVKNSGRAAYARIAAQVIEGRKK